MSDYDSDASERLERNTVRLTPPNSPPPQVSRRSSSAGSRASRASRGSKGTRNDQEPTRTKEKHKRKKRKSNYAPGDATFYKYFAPNNPELQRVGHNRIFQLDSSDEEEESATTQMDGSVKVPIPEPALGRPPLGGSSRIDVFSQTNTFPHYNEHSYSPMGYHSSSRAYYGSRTSAYERDTQTHYRTGSREFNDMGRPRASSIRLSISDNRQDGEAAHSLLQLTNGLPRRASTTSEVMATSPTLLPHLISPSQAAAEQTLPAIAEPSARAVQHPPPQRELSLPSVRELMGHPTSRPRTSSYSSVNSPPPLSPQDSMNRKLPQPVAAYPPGLPLSRQSTLDSRDAGSPNRDSFPRKSPEMMSHPIDVSYHPRRAPPRQNPNSIPTLTSTNDSSSGSSGSYSNTTNNTSTGSSTEPFTSHSSRGTPGDQSSASESASQSASNPQSAKYLHYPTVPIGGYKCHHDGCDAAPFSTQYLLNSHANVHSQERPHFCPVKGCPRGEGGQGFKRKNEMIRHGLVHQSPGYLCPWCDREHRYPRPDNLQRHVTSHHKDKSRDDPQLLAVLAQRAPGGVTRGRRRRT